MCMHEDPFLLTASCPYGVGCFPACISAALTLKQLPWKQSRLSQEGAVGLQGGGGVIRGGGVQG